MLPDSLAKTFTDFGLAGALALALIWVIWFVLGKVIPNLLTAFREEINAERLHCTVNRDQVIDAIKEAKEELAGKIEGVHRDVLKHG